MPTDFSLPDISKSYGRSKWLRLRVRARMALDPFLPWARREIVLRQRPVLDIGCGIGLLGISMRAAGIPLRYRGTDADPKNANRGKDSVRYYGFEDIGFDVLDAPATQIPQGATVCMIDSLQRLDSETQLAMLGKLADAAESGSLVLLRTTVRESGLGNLLLSLREFWAAATFRFLKKTLRFPRLEVIEQFLAGRGMACEVLRLRKRGPFSGVALRIEAPASRSA